MILMKLGPSKPLLIKINMVFLSLFLLIYAALRHHHPFSSIPPLQQQGKIIRDDHNKTITREIPSFLIGRRGLKMAMINVDNNDKELAKWGIHGKLIHVHFNPVSELFEWKHLFPEWVDEEEEIDGPSCPELPMPDFQKYKFIDVVVAKIPCRYPEQGWNRDVFRLQLHLMAANIAARNPRLETLLILSQCRPMVELFRCEDFVQRENNWWIFRPNLERMNQKLALPVGSCNLALPLWGKGIDETFNYDLKSKDNRTRKEAYVTVIHSSESYVCGAVVLAQSLLRTGTKRDLVLLAGGSISRTSLAALRLAGWRVRPMKRIRNPLAENGSYNEFNYSKLRLWQLMTDYEKVVFIDADIVVLRNLDVLFGFPQMAAVGNDGTVFNSGLMVVEPSICMFKILMGLRGKIRSYNGGDQGFFNEVFAWWHRLPRRVNFLKNFWSNSTVEAGLKEGMFGSEPAKVYAIHYIGLKPWVCYKDYDCNWDVGAQRVYASDAAHRRWWKVHDTMGEELQRQCRLEEGRKTELELDRKKARVEGLSGDHWKINITDPRRFL